MDRFHRKTLPLLPGAALALGMIAGSAEAQQTDADPAPGTPAGDALLAAAPASAAAIQAFAAPSTVPPGEAPESGLLNLSFTGYAWLTGMSGTTGVAGLEFDVDESFFDLVGESDSLFGLMGSIDAEYKRLVFQLNGVYSHAEFSGERTFAPGAGGAMIAIDADLKIDAAWFEVFGGYRFIDRPLGEAGASDSRLTLDGFLGGRFTAMELQTDVVAEQMVTLPNGTVLQAGVSQSIDQKEGWAELFLGGRMGLKLGEHWLLSVRGDVGGFGIGDSEFSWQAIAAAGYRWRLDGWSLDLFGGYRALGQNYSRSGFTWDVITYGPVLGAQVSIAF